MAKKLIKRTTAKPGAMATAQQALENEASQNQYLEILRGVKQEMYEDPIKQDNVTEEEAPEVEVKAESIQEMIESTKIRKSSGELKRVPIDSDLAEVYKMIASREGVTLSGFISNVLETYLNNHLKEVKKRLKHGNKFLV